MGDQKLKEQNPTSQRYPEKNYGNTYQVNSNSPMAYQTQYIPQNQKNDKGKFFNN
jgi:hypothetical protein